MEEVAKLRYARISPRKVKIVLDLIRNKPVDLALATLDLTPKARFRICVCRVSFLMIFVQSGMPPRLPAHDQCMLSHDISACSAT